MLRSLRFPGQTWDLPGTQGVVPEVVGAFPLPKAAARYNADASLLQELHAVEHVWGHFMGLREQGRTLESYLAFHSTNYKPNTTYGKLSFQ